MDLAAGSAPPSFDLVEFKDQNLFQGLTARNRFVTGVELGQHRRAQYLADYLRRLGAQTMVVEYDYTDGDYLDDYATFYVKCFQSYARRCNRLHFFSRRFDRQTFLKLVRGSLPSPESKAIQDSYLGFVVARPLPEAIVGRTVLKTYPSDHGRRQYPCVKTYHANLFGIDLKIKESLAFQEQDSVVAACATVALWCSFQKTSDLFGTAVPTPAAITRAANRFIHHSRPIPSSGLVAEQICDAIEAVGLEPEVFEVRETTPLPSLIYSYLGLGLPVILLVDIPRLGLHAITITGYSIRSEPSLRREVGKKAECLSMTGRRIDAFFAHDDQIGPFSRIEVRPSRKAGKQVYPVCFHGWDDPTGKRKLPFLPRLVIIPVYHKIRLTFLDVLQWVTRLDQALSRVVRPAARREWDICLTRSNDYKRSAAVRGTALETLRLRQHPRFIWRAALRADGIHLMEVLADATDIARSVPVYYAMWYHDEFAHEVAKMFAEPGYQQELVGELTRPFLELLKQTINNR